MKYLLMALMAVTILAGTTQAQHQLTSDARPFRISSLNTAFAVQAEFEGEYVIESDRIRLRVTKAEIQVSENCPYKGRRLLSALRFGLATRGERSWKVGAKGQKLLLDRTMSAGDKLKLDEMYFEIPLEVATDLSKHWLMMQIEEIALDLADSESRIGFSFAHSACDIFSQTQYEAKGRPSPKKCDRDAAVALGR
ncbi:MAG TPA: hypothetical protein VJU86_04920 [Pyrinomonadaceae bacterium]|nr:hypothetical protein [Pyrinomonadaceae bacterium]